MWDESDRQKMCPAFSLVESLASQAINPVSQAINPVSLAINPVSLATNPVSLATNPGSLATNSGSLAINSGSLATNPESLATNSEILAVNSESLATNRASQGTSIHSDVTPARPHCNPTKFATQTKQFYAAEARRHARLKQRKHVTHSGPAQRMWFRRPPGWHDAMSDAGFQDLLFVWDGRWRKGIWGDFLPFILGGVTSNSAQRTSPSGSERWRWSTQRATTERKSFETRAFRRIFVCSLRNEPERFSRRRSRARFSLADNRRSWNEV